MNERIEIAAWNRFSFGCSSPPAGDTGESTGILYATRAGWELPCLLPGRRLLIQCGEKTESTFPYRFKILILQVIYLCILFPLGMKELFASQT